MKLQLKKGRLLTRMLPPFVWFAAIGGIAVLVLHQSERVELQGIAYSYEQTINSVETGYIRSIPVSLYQTVKKGETLAVIKENTVARQEYEDASLQAQRATAEAELEQLKAQLRAAEDRFVADQHEHEIDVLSMERRMAVDLEQARLEILQIRSSLEPDRLSLKDLEVEIEIVKELVQQNAAEAYELQKVQTSHAVLEEQVMRSEQLLAQAEADYEAARLRKDEFEQKVPVRPQTADRELAPIRQAILVQEKRIEELIAQRDIIVLVAPFDGVVNTINYKAGQTVVRGDSIMTVVKPEPEYVMAWATQKDIGRFDVNLRVKVISQSAPHQSFESQVSHMGASLELIPERLWKIPTTPEWGRSIKIPIQPGFQCLHNEVLGIKTLL
ncbi:MAG: HlyD family secretion protein [Planctomycetota bacterium]|jgi:multidrug resistance efflux pump